MPSLSFNRAPTSLRATAADGDSVAAIPTAPQYGSASFQWNGFILERHLLPAGTLQTTVMTSHCLAIPRSQVPTPIHWQLNNQRVDGLMAAGKVYFRAAGDELASTWDSPLDAVFLSISPDAIGLAHEEAFRGKPAVPTISGWPNWCWISTPIFRAVASAVPCTSSPRCWPAGCVWSRSMHRPASLPSDR